MRFVLAHKQTDGDTNPLSTVKWPVELALISNEAGITQFVSMERINYVLAPVLRSVCHMTLEQLKLFPNTRELRVRHYTPLRNNLRDPSQSAHHPSPRTPHLRKSQGPLYLRPRTLPRPLPSQLFRGTYSPKDPSTWWSSVAASPQGWKQSFITPRGGFVYVGIYQPGRPQRHNTQTRPATQPAPPPPPSGGYGMMEHPPTHGC